MLTLTDIQTIMPLLDAGIKFAGMAVFQNDGSVTAGNSSGINDGAAVLMLASEDAVKKYNLTPIARFVSYGAAGVDPAVMGIGPVPASQKAMKRDGITVKDLDLVELNEAFAAQALACTRSWGLNDDDERINVNGGAIALGHPIGHVGAVAEKAHAFGKPQLARPVDRRAHRAQRAESDDVDALAGRRFDRPGRVHRRGPRADEPRRSRVALGARARDAPMRLRRHQATHPRV